MDFLTGKRIQMFTSSVFPFPLEFNLLDLAWKNGYLLFKKHARQIKQNNLADVFFGGVKCHFKS